MKAPKLISLIPTALLSRKVSNLLLNLVTESLAPAPCLNKCGDWEAVPVAYNSLGNEVCLICGEPVRF